MKLSVATNYEDELIDKLKGYPIYEIYGKMKNDILGGGRPDNSLKNIDREKFENHVKKVRSAGIKFNYLLNGSCLSNMEQSTTWQKKFREQLDYLKSIGVNALTVSNPYILQIIKKYYDCFTVRISTFACIDSLQKAKYWESIGADIVCVDFTKINRNFQLLSEMVQQLKKTKIELLCTNSCLKDCPLINTHTSALSHASNKFDDGTNYNDWCLLSCQEFQLRNVSEYIKSPWIRPEDIKFYENIGVEHFKITERDFPTEEIVKRVKAYCNRKYDGNLLDLIQGHGWATKDSINNIKKDNLVTKNDYLGEIKRVRGMGIPREFDRHLTINNNKLDGFIQFFLGNKCTNNCERCCYCKMIANKVIDVDKGVSDYLKELYDNYNDKKI